MREIKFRAWDLINDKFQEIESLIVNKKNIVIAISAVDVSRTMQVLHEDTKEDRGQIILSQYTGVKDINGKEICEGDIVKDLNYEDKYLCIVERHKTLKANMVARLITPIFGNYDFENLTDGNFEVIGNIYENPKLIN